MDPKRCNQNTKIIILLILILILSFLLRTYSLGFESLWEDEAETVYYAYRSVSENIEFSRTLGYFPLYHVMLSLWTKLFGISEISVRFLSVIFGTASVYLVFLIGTVMFNKKIGIYSSIIFALSPFNVDYSQQARVYTLFIFLSLLSIYFYLNYIRSRKNNHMVCYLISTLLMLNSHSPALFILVFQNLHYLIFLRKNIKKWIFIQFMLFLLFLPFFLVVISRMLVLSTGLFVPKPNLITLMRTFYIFSSGAVYELNALIFGSILAVTFGLLLSLLIIRTIKNIQNKNYSKLTEISFLFLWLIAPIVLMVLQAYFFYSIYFEKYVIPSTVALYILIALSISRLKNKVQMAAIMGIILISLSLLYIDYGIQEKGRWNDVADFIRLNKQKEDAVVIHVPDAIYSFTYYFDNDCFKTYNPSRDYNVLFCMTDQNIHAVDNANELTEEITEKDKVFLILHNAKYRDMKGTLLKYFSENYKLVQEQFYRHIKIYVFEK